MTEIRPSLVPKTEVCGICDRHGYCLGICADYVYDGRGVEIEAVHKCISFLDFSGQVET